MDWTRQLKHLQEKSGKAYWRSLEELAQTPQFQALLQREFPEGASHFTDPLGRRRFLQLMGASLALAGVTACTRQPPEKIVPYVVQPEEIIPGKPLFYATAHVLGGYGSGILVESQMGRPVKVEGNPDHPASLGASDAFAQASLLTLYDPDRSKVVLERGNITTWEAFFEALSTQLAWLQARQGEGLRLLVESVTSPTFAEQLNRLSERFPQALVHVYEPVSRDAFYQGTRLAFGEPLEVLWDFEKADVVLSLDGDFLYWGPASLRYTRQFTAGREWTSAGSMNRLYMVQSSPTLTGAMADHCWSMAAARLEDLARDLAQRLGLPVQRRADTPHGLTEERVKALVRDLENHRGRSLVLAGEFQSPTLHALVHALNLQLENVGRTVHYTEPVQAITQDQFQSLTTLVEDMEEGRVQTLIILGGNPVYTAPADQPFAAALEKVPLRIRLGLYEDETSRLCHWHLPQSHLLESWGDARAFDGTVSLIQPLIAPLYASRSPWELLEALLGSPGKSGYEILRDYWRQRWNREEDFEQGWQRSLHDGCIEGTQAPAKEVSLQLPPELAAGSPGSGEGDSGEWEILFRPDPTVYDGRFANNGWLQELPKPLTRLTWDNAVLLSPQAARRLGVSNQDVVRVRWRDRQVEGPVWIQPGHAPDSVTLHLGYGRTRAGKVGTGAGFDAYRLRSSRSPWILQGGYLEPTGKRYPLACTQDHHSMEGRHLVRSATRREFEENPHFVQKYSHQPPEDLTLYPDEHRSQGYAWGMVINLNACTGCGACVLACQSENNIPVVGKDQVRAGREMHWIRVDRYYEGAPERPGVYHQPVMCMHCENAPCEVVCPVGATVHSDEGLNEMVYNRCVGTRYCSNNCPYKVRRFNFLQYSDYQTPSLKLLHNPDVTVRTRGVMEKCTYCVQRINQARIQAEKEDRSIRDGEIQTACQAVCPARAISFGDLNDPQSEVSRKRSSPLNYGILTELNTRPRTTYLARLRNPNPELDHE